MYCGDHSLFYHVMYYENFLFFFDHVIYSLHTATLTRGRIQHLPFSEVLISSLACSVRRDFLKHIQKIMSVEEKHGELCQGAQEESPANAAMEADWGVDISSDNDKMLFKKILITGKGSECPMTGDEVEVHYRGWLMNGDIFDSSVERNEKFKFKLGQSQVIKGWDVGVATMTRGEKCLLTCKPEYAYGSSGSPPKIGPDEILQFEVELFDWKGEDITGDGGVSKSTLVSGEGFSTPQDGSMVEGIM